MPLITANFTQYVVYYIAGASAAAGMPQDAEIDCFDGAGNRAGAIYFHSGSSRLPKNQNTVNGIYLYFRMARFSDVMTMLKDEKPLYLALNTDNQVGYIGTSSEAVGEQEAP
jgi:hypothetical protein